MRRRISLRLRSARAQTRERETGIEVRAALGCWVALAAATAVAAGLAAAWHALGPANHPHAVLKPSLGAIASIMANNLRVLAAPFILVAARFPRVRVGRVAGDAVVAAILTANATTVGLALGRWRAALVPFIPQLPIEYLAAATAAAAWLGARRHSGGDGHVRTLILASATFAFTAVAAVLEVLLTPHAR
ncbi:MAG: hypothetical protein ACYC0H_23180 [Solirubrobacteraceae bacterium]